MNDSMKPMKIKKSHLVLAAAFMVLLPVWLIRMDGAGKLLGALTSAKPMWMLAALGLMVCYWLFEAGILHMAVRQFYGGQRFSSTLDTTMIGQFFNCVTPFASGGQPVQAFHMLRAGVPLGTASCALMVKFIVYQFVLTVYSLVTLCFSFGFFSGKVHNLFWLVLVGFGVNTAVILGLLFISLFDKGARRLTAFFIRLSGRLRLVKDPEAAQKKAEAELDSFYEGFTLIRKNKLLVLRMALLTVLQLTVYFMVPYILLRGFGVTGAGLFTVISAQAFVLNISSFVPLPGAAGGAELSFHALFGMFFPSGLLSASILLWRGFTYYLPILVGGGFFALFLRGGAGGKGRKRGTEKARVRPAPKLSDGAA